MASELDDYENSNNVLLDLPAPGQHLEIVVTPGDGPELEMAAGEEYPVHVGQRRCTTWRRRTVAMVRLGRGPGERPIQLPLDELLTAQPRKGRRLVR